MKKQSPKKKSKKKKLKVIIEFEPDPNFEEEFAEFIGEILSEKKQKGQIKKNKNL